MSVTFRVYYDDGTVYRGNDWRACPDEGVQVVVVEQPWPSPPPDVVQTGFVWTGRKDQTFYTGVDAYDPLGTGHKKRGKLIPDEDYGLIWDRAYGDC